MLKSIWCANQSVSFLRQAMDTSPLLLYSLVSVTVLFACFHFGKRFVAGRQRLDYFKLSGVPPPTPLPDFDVDKAKARPYRPFRWAYHQTMCTLLLFVEASGI